MGLTWWLSRVKAEGKVTRDEALRAVGGGMHGAVWEKKETTDRGRQQCELTRIAIIQNLRIRAAH